MSWEEVERFLEAGGAGRPLVELIGRIRGDEALRERVREEILLIAAATPVATTVQIDLYLLDDFLKDRTPMPLRAFLLSAVCRDDSLWRRLGQLQRMYEAAEQYEEDTEGEAPPDEIREAASGYEAAVGEDVGGEGGTVTLASLRCLHGRWRVEEGNPSYDYDIRPRPAASLESESAGLQQVDDATIRHGAVRCAIALSPGERRLTLQIENCPLDRERFMVATALLRHEESTLPPARRTHDPRLSRIVFEGVDPAANYLIEIDPALLGG